MLRRALKTATAISSMMLAIAVMLFLTGYVLSPRNHFLSLSKNSHVGVWGRGLDSRIVFFSDAQLGPYRGSITSLVDDLDRVRLPPERETAFGDSWGIYYRYLQWSDIRQWTLMLSLWYPIVAFAILPIMHLLRRRWQHRSARLIPFQAA